MRKVFKKLFVAAFIFSTILFLAPSPIFADCTLNVSGNQQLITVTGSNIDTPDFGWLQIEIVPGLSGSTTTKGVELEGKNLKPMTFGPFKEGEYTISLVHVKQLGMPQVKETWCKTIIAVRADGSMNETGGIPINIQGSCRHEGEIDTALGCIPVNDPTQFVAWLLGRAIGVAGGIAFLLMVVASFQIITSSGNPERLQGGKELLGSALTGLLFIIFSVYLLKLIGVSLLQIPGL